MEENKKKPYKMMKVFDSQRGMPEKIKEAFFDHTSGCGAGNDVYLSIEMESLKEQMDPEEYNDTEQTKKLYDWLLEQGVKETETVIIKHWW